jgi:hypothetical protein
MEIIVVPAPDPVNRVAVRVWHLRHEGDGYCVYALLI